MTRPIIPQYGNAVKPSLSRLDPFDLRQEYEHHVVLDHVVPLESATARTQFEGISRAIRDTLSQQWLRTQQTYDHENPKRVYYLSMEYLIGRTLLNNLNNFRLEAEVAEFLQEEKIENWPEILETEPDAGLGNGGLGRLAACFIESMATQGIPAVGYGLRYEYGIFRQSIENGYQVEQPDEWLALADPWEVARSEDTVTIPVNCSFLLENRNLKAVPGHASNLRGIPYDRPIVGYGGRNVNTLRLWSAASPDQFDLREFSSGDFVGAVVDRVVAASVTRVLYPNDSTVAGQALRFVQEYFLVCCSLQDIVSRYRARNPTIHHLSDKIAIQLNDTHPAMAVAELMRILLDEDRLTWEEAWQLTVDSLAYTNHTLLPEALEKWPVYFFQLVCPRLLEIIYEINRRFLIEVQCRYPQEPDRIPRMSLIEGGESPSIRMAHLAIVGTHSTNGVSKIHSDLLRTRVVQPFADMFPGRFNNKTNGVTPRRWLLLANPQLAELITDAIGDQWLDDLSQLRGLTSLADDAAFQERFLKGKQEAKNRFVAWLKQSTGERVDPKTLFDSQIKRIHEYKRQVLNLLHIIVLYNRILDNPSIEIPPRTFFFAGKAAPAYQLAKLVIKLINNVGRTIEAHPIVRDRIRVIFLANYNVSLAQRLIPASDISEQISTAGYEASGTGNMKFMMNGALTIGTRDGATIEMAEEAGEENLFLFGLTADQVSESRGWYNPRWHYDHEEETRRALDLIFDNRFSPNEPGIFEPIRSTIMDSDYYMHLADLTSYTKAHEQVGKLYSDRKSWVKRAIINVASAGKFSSDRAIREYAAEIWNARACPVEPYNAKEEMV